jgi:hypothetical protein
MEQTVQKKPKDDDANEMPRQDLLFPKNTWTHELKLLMSDPTRYHSQRAWFTQKELGS